MKFLIPGDNESPSWEELLKRPEFRSAIAGTDVLVAAHHGRESGFYRPLFEHFKPRITLISDGRAVGTSVTGKYDDVTQVSRASTKHTSEAEQKCTTREVIGQRKCPRQLFGRSVTEAGWQQAGRVSE